MNEAEHGTRNTGAMTIAGMILVVVGMQVFIIQPGLVAIFAQRLALSEDWAGYIASGEMAGIAAATIAAALAGARLPWRRTLLLAIGLIVAGNLASVWIREPALFLFARTVAGFGCGFLISIGYSAVGLADNPDRAFGKLITFVLLYGAAGVFVLPAAGNAIGLGGIMIVLTAISVASVAAALRLPLIAPAAAQQDAATAEHGLPGRLLQPGPVLLAAGLFFLGQGFVWAFLGLIGLSFGNSEQAVANGLTVAQLAGVGGAFLLAWLGGKVSQRSFLLSGSLGSFIPLLAITGGAGALFYGGAVTVFNLSANVLTPLLMAMAAGADTTGRTVQRAAAVQMIGLAAGPALAAPIAGNFGFAPVLVIASLLFAATAVFGFIALPSRKKLAQQAG